MFSGKAPTETVDAGESEAELDKWLKDLDEGEFIDAPAGDEFSVGASVAG